MLGIRPRACFCPPGAHGVAKATTVTGGYGARRSLPPAKVPDVTGAFVKAVWPNLGTQGELSGSKACRLSPEDTWGLAREEGAACAAEKRAAPGRVGSGSVGQRQGEPRAGRGEERQEAGTDPREPGSHSKGDGPDVRRRAIHWGAERPLVSREGGLWSRNSSRGHMVRAGLVAWTRRAADGREEEGRPRGGRVRSRGRGLKWGLGLGGRNGWKFQARR